MRTRNLIVQIGTQHRSEPYQTAAKNVIPQGTLGDISKVEMMWNYHGARWRGRPEVKQHGCALHLQALGIEFQAKQHPLRGHRPDARLVGSVRSIRRAARF